MEEKGNKYDLIRIKTALQKTLLKEWKDTWQTGRKYLQNDLQKKTCIQNIQRTHKTEL